MIARALRLCSSGARFVPLAALCLASLASSTRAEPHRRVAVLEFRGGVAHVPELAVEIADHLSRTAALSIIDLPEARRRSATVDADIARCAGDTACTAEVGRGIGADEVLLVAISQLGDLVLTLERIDVRGAKVLTQLSEVLPSQSEIRSRMLDAWMHRLYSPDAFKRYGYIVIAADLDGARVLVDGQLRGTTPLPAPLRVPAPRTYRVALDKPERVPFSARIDVVPDATVEVRAELPKSTAPVPWYKRWYPWTSVGLAVAGAAVGTLIYVTRPDDSRSAGYVVLPGM